MGLGVGGVVSVPPGAGGRWAGPATAGWPSWTAMGARVRVGGPGGCPGNLLTWTLFLLTSSFPTPLSLDSVSKGHSSPKRWHLEMREAADGEAPSLILQ